LIRPLVTTIVSFVFASSALSMQVREFDQSKDLPKLLDLSQVRSVKNLTPEARLKWYELKSSWPECVSEAKKMQKDNKLGLWVGHTYLKCLRSLYKRNKKIKPAVVSQHFLEFTMDQDILHSPFTGHRDLLLQVYLDLINFTSDKDRTSFEALVNKGSHLVDYMSSDQRASLYRAMGEVAWLQQKSEVAINNFLRSYNLKPDKKVLSRLKELKAAGLLSLEKYSFDSLDSDEEMRLWSRFKKSLDKGETINVARYGVEFLKASPGSHRMDKVRDGINRFYKRVLYLRGDKYESMKREFESKLAEAPPEFVVYWATEAYQRGYQDSSYRLASQAVKAWEDSSYAPEALILAGRSAYYLSKRIEAQKLFETLIDRYSGHIATAEARYLLGLLLYREKQFDKLINLYERFLTSRESDRWELQVRYWLWRALKNTNSPRAQAISKTILRDFPLTYYGLIVRMSEKQSLQSLWTQTPSQAAPFKMWWTGHLDERYQRIRNLISSGWVDEAELEILYMPDPQTADGYMFRAQLWESAGLMSRVLTDHSNAIHSDERFLNPDVLKSSFPQIYSDYVLQAEKSFQVPRHLIWAIMRQESAFMPRAVSPSRAYGLMQLLGPTAKETARWLKVNNFRVDPHIFDPKTNIRFGSHFLSRMLKKYQGVVPLAVASYNVGPGNLDRWLSYRPDMMEWQRIGESLDDDIWVDELPWAETSFYVKAVMRNFLLYQITHEEKNILASPPWGGPESSPMVDGETTAEEDS
jgi:soluble lytic murein transglycosylase